MYPALATASYVFATPVFGGQATVTMTGIYGASSSTSLPVLIWITPSLARRF